MSTATPAAAGREARSAARGVADNPWGDRLARVGIASRALVFVLLGYLVARIALGALGDGGTDKAASGPGVANAIVEQSGGSVVLFLLGIGLLFFAMFSVLEALRVSESSDAKRWAKRARSAWQAGLYTAFGIYCLVKATTSGGDSGTSSQSSRQQEQWSARVLRWPAGWLWLGALGVALLAIAIYQTYRCVKRKFLDHLKTQEMSPRVRQIVTVVGIVGHVGRAASFALVGWFVLHAAVENDPKKGRGVDGAARMLANSTGGPVLLWLLAIGLVIFGAYLFFEARYREV